MSNRLRLNNDGKRRPLRLGAEFERVMPDLIRDLTDLPSTVLVTVTGVTVSPDLSLAQVFFSVIGESMSGADIEDELNRLRGKFRTEIAQRFVMRQHPEIKFHYDETPERAARIEALLREARGESEA
ncbi:MAG: 30S ribosome-binding factor RbfA [bacterium]|nr:30S ribosome-binding factor RbfA [bacterium]